MTKTIKTVVCFNKQTNFKLIGESRILKYRITVFIKRSNSFCFEKLNIFFSQPATQKIAKHLLKSYLLITSSLTKHFQFILHFPSQMYAEYYLLQRLYQ